VGINGLGIIFQWWMSFAMPFQTGPEAHPTSCATSTGSFLGIKRPDLGVDNAAPSSVWLLMGLELYLCLNSMRAWACHVVDYTFIIAVRFSNL